MCLLCSLREILQKKEEEKNEYTNEFYDRHKNNGDMSNDHAGAPECFILFSSLCSFCVAVHAASAGADCALSEYRCAAGTESDLLVPRGADTVSGEVCHTEECYDTQ